jgi:2'-5' RNA ligase
MPRLFVAIRPPLAVRETLLAAMGGIDGARWQDDAQLHLTLAFAGEADNRQARALETALEEVESPPFAAEIAGVGHSEKKGAPFSVWAMVPPGEPLARLQRRIERACRRAGLPPEKRAYRPHVTLARLPRSAGPIGAWLARHGTLHAGPWQVDGFTLYESHLRPGGSVYDALVDYEF